MGCTTSRPNYQQYGNADEETVPLIDDINVVLIGCKNSGKTKVANAILGKKAFTQTTYSDEYVQRQKTTFGRTISVIRVPGWSGDLKSGGNEQKHVRQVIKDSVWSFKPGTNAIILVVEKDTQLSSTTKSTLKTLLGPGVAEHILVISTDGNKISVATISEHYNNKQTIIQPYQNHYLFWRKICRNQHLKLIETIEDFIVGNNDIYFCPVGKGEPKPALQIEQLETVVNRLSQRISQYTDRNNEMNNEISKLQKVLGKKQETLKALRFKNSTELSVLHGGIPQFDEDRREEEVKGKGKKRSNKKTRKRKRGRNKHAHKEDAQELVPLCSAEETPVEEKQASKGVDFVDSFRAEIIQKVTSVEPILDELFQFIGGEQYSNVTQHKTPQKKLRELYTILNARGPKLKAKFYKSLVKYENGIVNELYEGVSESTNHKDCVRTQGFVTFRKKTS
ncbi:uncharacterized protein LOC107197094 [Astyanax mexicanus]|uniref:uncharacterized protein LOC107197094 n=1 Tax=Astyanax mexicanus TaxID=7994 RepID=UPI0020CAA401|nr:uncharacterized protein LOC107197094 [Astyanax mexicanus]